MSDYQKMTDDELLALLFTEEDRLPREAVEEFIRRGEKMVKPLSDIISAQYLWMNDGVKGWAAIHGVNILGAIGGRSSVIPLLRAARWAVAYDCDWITEDMPSIFGKLGTIAMEELKKIAKDRTSDWYTRAIAIEGLAAITIYNPETEKEIFPFIHSILIDDNEERDAIQTAAHVLLDFLRQEYKEDLLNFGRKERELKQKDINYTASFYEDEVEKDFSRGVKDIWTYTNDWLSFYDENEIRKRQERWEKEDEEERRQQAAEGASLRPKIGRNDPCPCGSGKKYKKCCMGKEH